MQTRHRSAWWIAAVVAGVFLLAHLFIVLLVYPERSRLIFGDLLTVIVDCLVTVVFFYTAWRLRVQPEQSLRRMGLAWGLLGIAMLFTTAGDALWVNFEIWLGIRPNPSAADILFLCFYLLFVAGLLMLPGRLGSGLERLKTGLEMSIVFLAALLGFWKVLFAPQIEAAGNDFMTVAISLASPVGAVALLGGLITVLYRPSRLENRLPLWLLASGVFFMILFDCLYGYLSLESRYHSGTLLDLNYTTVHLLFAAAGFVQLPQLGKRAQLLSLRPDVQGTGAPNHRMGFWLRYLPYLVLAVAYLLLLSKDQAQGSFSSMVTAAVVGLLVALVLARQMVALQENRRLYADLQYAHAQVRRQAAVLDSVNQEMRAEIETRQKVEERLTHDALHDALTGLPNRALFLDRLTQAGNHKKRRPNYQYAVLFLDLDSFKVINDSLGHHTGDQLLVRAAQILLGCVRLTDTVARLGGDEFVILLDDLASPENVTITANRLLAELSSPIQLERARVFVSVSIGIVNHIEEYQQAEDILRDADLAMYQAKLHGKGRFMVFHESMRASAIHRMELENDLRKALEEKQFILHYQPILSLPERRLVGFEALVRWLHPLRGMLPPMEFIPIAEETGLILPLGKWILTEACRQAQYWREEFPGMPMRVSVNVSGRQLKQPDFVGMVAQALEQTCLPPGCLALEVTESVCLDNLERVSKTLSALHVLGVETQIDDFGTGYSSLSYLQRLPVRSIKIDRSFINEIVANDSSVPGIVGAIFSMVNSLGITAVAEGIENEAQLDILSKLHCSYVQGFLLARPMENSSVETWIAARHQQSYQARNTSSQFAV